MDMSHTGVDKFLTPGETRAFGYLIKYCKLIVLGGACFHGICVGALVLDSSAGVMR